MSEKLIKRIGQNSLDDLCEKTIGQLLDDEQSEITVKGGNLTIRQVQPDKILTLNITKYSDGGQEAKATCHRNTEVKRDRLAVAQEMKARGKKQKDIANELGMSESYVSKLLKSNK